MKKLIYIFVAGTILVTSACKPPQKGEDKSSEASATVEADAPSAASERVYNVKVMTIKTETLESTLDYTATLAAFEEVHFASASPGRVDNIYVEIGDKIKTGQVLVEMDQTQLVQAKIQLENAKTNLERLESLMETKSISEQQYDQVKTQFDLAKTNVEFLEENTKLLAPFNGVVTGKYFEDGEMFSGAPNTQAGKAAILSLMQIDPLKVLVNVSETFFPKVYNGMKANVKSDIYPDTTFVGKVSNIYPTIDPMSRTFKVEVVLNNREEILRPGMFARVSLSMGSYSTIVVPSISLIQQEGTNEKYIFVYDNGTAKKMKVKTAKRFDDKIEIVANGVQPGMKLIVAGQGNLLNGYKVRIVE